MNAKRFFTALLVAVMAISSVAFAAPAAAQQQCVTVNGNEVCGEASFVASIIASLNSAPAATATPVAETAPVAEEASTAFTGSESYDGWSLLQFVPYFDVYEIEGERWLMPLGTHYAVDTSGGRYEAVVSAPVGEVNGVDYGWCGAGQLDCPPHGFLGRVSVEAGADVEAVMDISYRLNLHNNDAVARPVRVQLRFNNVADALRAGEAVSAPRTPAELLEDYHTLAREGDLGLFVAVKDALMEEGVLALDSFGYEFGYSCWDCLADTQGPTSERPLPLNNPEMSRFGTPTPALASSIVPGRVIPIPSPADEPTFAVDFEVLVQPGTTVVIWLGRYDVPDVVTPTPTATPIS